MLNDWCATIVKARMRSVVYSLRGVHRLAYFYAVTVQNITRGYIVVGVWYAVRKAAFSNVIEVLGITNTTAHEYRWTAFISFLNLVEGGKTRVCFCGPMVRY